MPHLLILLYHKKKKKRRGRLLFLRSKPSVCLDLVNTAWRLERVGADRENRAGGVKCPGSDALREHTEEKKNQVSGKNGLGKQGSKTAEKEELP